MTITLAIVLGTLFGFILQRVGASDPDKIIGMLKLKDLHLMKAILLGIAVSSLLLFTLITVGVISPENLSVKGIYWGVPIGGLLLGLGWGISGYCPGTGIVSMGSGRKEAAFFVLGGLVGAGLLSWLYEPLAKLGLFEAILGGKMTLARTSEYESLLPSIPGIVTAGVIAGAMLVLVFLLARKKEDEQKS